MKLVNIVATVGPKTNTLEAISLLLEAGVNVFRLNGSHSNLNWHSEAIRNIREADPSVPILLDIPGAKVRTGDLGEGVPLAVGQELRFGLAVNEGFIPTTLEKIPADIRVGQTVFADDGTLEFEITEIHEDNFTCVSRSLGRLGTAKGLNFPNSLISDGALSGRDKEMLSFAVEHNLDFVGISFVHSARQVMLVRDFVGNEGPHILAKIENQAGFENRQEVIDAADAIMIDRGDLAAETGKFEVGVRQAAIVKECLSLAKPVIIATEVMHSMIRNPFPTKAEVSDVTTAVLQGASATMLSGETAVGDYPFEAVTAMKKILTAAEASLEVAKQAPLDPVEDLMLDAASVLAASAKVDKCVVFTRTGHAARRLSSRLNGIEIIAVSDSERTARTCNILRGVRGFVSSGEFSRKSADFVQTELKALLENEVLKRGDRVLITGLLFPYEGEKQNFVLVTKLTD